MRICSNCGERNPDRARFCMGCAEPLDRSSHHRDERKVVSMVFVDLQGSTAMAERLDHEVVRALLMRFYVVSREILERHGGTVEKFIGDAVMGVFGVPRTHEDDALRAVRSAVELRDTIEQTNEELIDRYRVGLRPRIGVNTGEVLAGDPTTGSSFVSGDPVNVAARLEQSAAAGEILIGEQTHRAVAHLVRAEPVEPLALKGKSEPVIAYRLAEVLDYAENRPMGSPLVGRDPEITLLQRALQKVQDTRSPAMMLIGGVPGIGKSRLVKEFLRTAEDTATIVATRCMAESDVPWRLVFADVVSQLMGPMDGSSAEDAKERITRLLGSTERAPLIATEAVGLAGLGPQGSFEAGSWAIRELIDAVASRRPVILSIDDLQWGGPEVVESLQGILGTARGPVLVIGTAQPEFITERDGVSTAIPERADRLDLRPLDRSDALLVAEHLLGTSLDEHAGKVLVDAAGGNPLFLAETIRMIRDRASLLHEDEPWTGLVRGEEIPTSIRSLIAARLDLLGDLDRETLCSAAVLGPVADVEDLRAIAPPEILEDLDARLRRLVERQLLEEEGRSTLRFPHGLVRDVAYAALTKQARSELHAACADRLESHRDLAGAGSHLERAYQLRRELGLEDVEARRLARRAAIFLSAAGLSCLEQRDRRAALAFEGRACQLAPTFEDEAPSELSELAFRLGAWTDVASLLDRRSDDALDPAEAHRLGVALVKADGDQGADVERGRRLLKQAGAAGDMDALAALAGTWKGEDDDQARDLYRAVLSIDPSEPYALGNLLEYEIERTKDLSVVDEMRVSIDEAVERRRAQAVAGLDVPWSWFDLGKFELLVGASGQAYRSFSAGVLTSSAAYMARSALASVERLARCAPHHPGTAEVTDLLRLSAVAVFDTDARSIVGLATPERSSLAPPILIIAGASDVTASIVVSKLRAPLLKALAETPFTVVSGGTTSGVSALAGDVAQAMPSIRAIGYLPAAMLGEAEENVRYSELRTTDGSSFGSREPLQYWADILTSDVDPADVRMLAIGGGHLSGIEYRTALAFGARVAVLRDSGREASALLRDTTWALSDRLVELSPSEDELRSFLTSGA